MDLNSMTTIENISAAITFVALVFALAILLCYNSLAKSVGLERRKRRRSLAILIVSYIAMVTILIYNM